MSVSESRSDFSFPGGNMEFKVNYTCTHTGFVYLVVDVKTKRGGNASSKHIRDSLLCSSGSVKAFVARFGGQTDFGAGSQIEFKSRLSREKDRALLAQKTQEFCPAHTIEECPQ
ncbi:hypothetical protein [Streptomyces noursei]|uniref:hypothetical protein n=1 Tax=Streptomyces noursei TaxID=1971 RepID=UPI0030F12B0E